MKKAIFAIFVSVGVVSTAIAAPKVCGEAWICNSNGCELVSVTWCN